MLRYKLFAVNLTGVPLVRFSTCSTANRARWVLRVYRGLISAERTVAAVMDGLGVRCDSANLRLLSQVYRNKIERKFLVPHSTRKGEKSAIRCSTAKCHLMCQVCLAALLKFDSFPLNERSDIARYCQPFFYMYYSFTIISATLSLRLLASHFALRCHTLSSISLSR